MVSPYSGLVKPGATPAVGLEGVGQSRLGGPSAHAPLNLDTFCKEVKVAAAVKIMPAQVLCLSRGVWLPVECKVCPLTTCDNQAVLDNGAQGRGLRCEMSTHRGRRESFFPHQCAGRKFGRLTIMCSGPPQRLSRVTRRNAYIMGSFVSASAQRAGIVLHKSCYGRRGIHPPTCFCKHPLMASAI